MIVRLLLALALLVPAGLAHAGDKPLYAPAPAWVEKPAPVDATRIGDSDPVFLRLDQQHLLQNGMVTRFTDTVIHITTAQLLTQIGTVQLPWDPAKGDITIHQLEIVRGAEHIDLIAGGQRFSVLRREQQLEQAALNGVLSATLAVQGLRIGDVIHVAFSITERDPALHGNVQTIAPIPIPPMPLKAGRIRILWPDALKVQWRDQIAGTQPTLVDRPDGYQELVLMLPVEKPADVPDDAPARYTPLPLLEATSYADWAGVSKDMAPLFATEGTIRPDGPIAAEVARIAAATGDPRERAAFALQLVQDKVRYLYSGMDNGNYVPQSPEQTWQLRYGDCKAKSLLLLAILRALGIEAEAVLANAVLGDHLPQRLPAPAAFNHVIVRATIGGEALWLDGTQTGARLADIGDSPTFHYVLPLRPGGSDLIPVPMHPSARPDTEIEVEMDARAGIAFPGPFRAHIALRGQTGEMLRAIQSQLGPEQVQTMVAGMLAGYVPNAEIVDPEVTFDDATGIATVDASGIFWLFWARDGDRFALQLDRQVDGISFSPDRSRPAWREIPVGSGSPSSTRVVTRLRLPDGAKGFVFKGDETLPTMLAGNALSRSVAIAGDTVTVDDRIDTGFAEVAPADIPAARREVALAKSRLLKLRTPADYPTRARVIRATRGTKAFDAVLAVYGARIAADPKSAAPYLARASFFQAIADPAAALRDLDKAIELDPSADNHARRAALRETTGDEKGAVADLRLAQELDPGSASILGNLARLIARAGDSDAALEMLADRIAAGGDGANDLVSVQASVLADTGRIDEATAAFDRAVDASRGNPTLLNNRCWFKGTHNVMLDSALKDCTKSIELSENPSAALDSRAMVYFRLGRNDDALADLDAALDAAPDQSASLFMRGVIEAKLGKAEASRRDLADARTFAPRIEEEYARYGIKP